MPMKPRILIVDDDPGMRRLLSNLLVREYAVREARSGEEALVIAAAWHPDLVFLDLVMCGIDGHETCRQLKMLPMLVPPQVIVVSASSLAEDMRLAFEAGADDYFVKPIRSCELMSRAQIHMRLRYALKSSADANSGDVSREPDATDTNDIHAIQDIAVFAMTKLAETRDNDTGEHLNRIRDYSTRLAEEVKQTAAYGHDVTEEFLEDIFRSSPLHDIGKVGVPDSILLKPGRLTAHEYDIMKQHTVIGAGILEQTSAQSNAGTFLKMAVDIARSHHERWDGSGYPACLSGADIPLAARIVAVADVFDALTSKRQYKPAWSTERACAYILERADSHFDPVVAKCFGRCFEDIERIHRQYAPPEIENSRQNPPRLTIVAASQ